VLLAELNKLGGANGVGRVDLVENRFVGMKSRGVYETPGGTILYKPPTAPSNPSPWTARSCSMRDQMSPKIAQLIYNGFWFSPEFDALHDLRQQEPGKRHRHRAHPPLQGQLHRRGPQGAQDPSTTRRSPPSKKTKGPTTSWTPPASLT
jgi:hypothetical protein